MNDNLQPRLDKTPTFCKETGKDIYVEDTFSVFQYVRFISLHNGFMVGLIVDTFFKGLRVK